MKIVYVYSDHPVEWKCSLERYAVPAKAINGTNRNSASLLTLEEFIFDTPAARNACDTADLIVVQRNLFGPVLSAVQHWKARDKTVIADFDEAFDLLPENHHSYLFWSQGYLRGPDGQIGKLDPPPLVQFKWGLRLVDAATAASRRLADDWRSFSDVHFLPSYLELEKYRNTLSSDHDDIWIGWSGSSAHLQSFTDSGVLTALQHVCQARPQVKVVICGNDRQIFDQLKLPEDQKIFSPWLSTEKWAQLLANFDIGIQPISGDYAHRRGCTRILEYMVMKIPWVASESPAHHDLRSYGWLIHNTTSAWERMLFDMVDHLEDYRAEARKEAYLYGLSQGIEENVQTILQTYKNILAHSAAHSAAHSSPLVPAKKTNNDLHLSQSQ